MEEGTRVARGQSRWRGTRELKLLAMSQGEAQPQSLPPARATSKQSNTLSQPKEASSGDIGNIRGQTLGRRVSKVIDRVHSLMS